MAVSTSTIQRTRSHRRTRYLHDPAPASLIPFNPVRYSEVSTKTGNPERTYISPISLESQETRPTSKQESPSSTAEIAQACYTIDSAICVPISETTSWKDLDENTYLSSESLITRWENDLENLCENYLRGVFTPDVFGVKLEAIMPPVRRLEDARDELRDVLDQKVWMALDRRCAVLENAFRGLERRLAEMDREE